LNPRTDTEHRAVSVHLQAWSFLITFLLYINIFTKATSIEFITQV